MDVPSIVTDTKSAGLGRVGWRLLGFLPVQAMVWTLAAWLSTGNLDMQGDMLENYSWGIEWQAGYAKHPPLFAWITAAWFKLFPHVDLAYYALSSLNAMVGLLGIAALAACFIPAEFAALAALAMAISPMYSTLAMKFNANAVLLSVWPWAAYAYVRAMRTGATFWSLLFGVMAGAAMLGKYFSIVLWIGLSITTMVRPGWRVRLLQKAAPLAAAAVLLTLTPHLLWLQTHHFPTLQYAEHRTGGGLIAAMQRYFHYASAQIAYLLPSFLMARALTKTQMRRPMLGMVEAMFYPSNHPDLWWLAFSPLFAVGLIAVVGRTEMASVWGMAEWFAIAPLWLATLASHPSSSISLERVLRVFVVYWMIVLAGSCWMGYQGVRNNRIDASEPRAELGRTAQFIWQQHTGQAEAPIVSGSEKEARSVAFYGGNRTLYRDFHDPSLATSAKVFGMLIVCRIDDRSCQSWASGFSGNLGTDIVVHKHAWWHDLPAQHALIYIVAPPLRAHLPK